MPERDLPDDAFTISFGGAGHGGRGVEHVFGAPRDFAGDYVSEFDLMRSLNETALSCTRHYVLDEWYARLVRAAGRLPPPLWTGDPVPTWSESHDAKVRTTRRAAV